MSSQTSSMTKGMSGEHWQPSPSPLTSASAPVSSEKQQKIRSVQRPVIRKVQDQPKPPSPVGLVHQEPGSSSSSAKGLETVPAAIKEDTPVVGKVASRKNSQVSLQYCVTQVWPRSPVQRRQIQSHCFWAEQATVLPQSLHLVVVTVFVPATSVSVETVCSCVRVFVRPHCADY